MRLLFSIRSAFHAIDALKAIVLAEWAVLMVLLALPLPAVVPAVGLDASWQFALAEISRKGLAFGSDIACIHGPYHFLLTRLIQPALMPFEMFISMLWALSYTACFFSVARSAPHRNVALLLSLLISLLLTSDAGSYDVGQYILRDAFFHCSLFIAYACLLCPAGRISQLAALFIIAIAPFNKISFGVTALGLLGLAACFLIYRKDYRRMAGVMGQWFIITLALWLAAGQNLFDLPPYFINLIVTSFNHGDAMKIAGNPVDVIVGLLTLALGLFALWRDGKRLPGNNILIAGFAFVLFVVFKGGFVRHDVHAVLVAGVLLFLACYILMKEWSRFNLSTAAACLLSAGYLWFAAQVPFANILAVAGNNIAAHFEGALDVLHGGPNLKANFTAAVENIRATNPLPPLTGTVDSVSYHQSELIASGLDYHPRPTLQSVIAFCPWLSDMNERAVVRHPSDYVLFNIEPIDYRYPAMEEGRLMLDWLSRYTFQERTVQGALVLRARPAAGSISHAPLIVPLKDIVAHLDEVVDVPVTDSIVLAEITLKPTLFGRLLGLFYKRSALGMAVHTATGYDWGHMFIAGMGRGGFVLSPYIRDTQAMEWLITHAGQTGDAAPAVTSFVIHALPGPGWDTWDTAYHVRLFTVTLPSHPN